MLGAGTQDNPYLIETWSDYEEVGNMPKTADQARLIYSRLVQDLDGNDYNDGIFKITKAPVNLDGGGHMIRNIYLYNDTESYTDNGIFQIGWYAHYYWSNLILENIMTNFCIFGSIDNTFLYTLRNCTINGAAKALAKSSVECEECTISIDTASGLASACSNALKPVLRRCSANVRASAPTLDTLNFNSFTSRIEMELNKPTEIELDESRILTCRNSVLSLKLSDGDKTAWNISGHESNISVLDSTLWGDGVTTGIAEGIVPLSTMEMKNADELNAAGFVVVRIS